VRARRPGAIISVSPNYYDFAYKLQLQDWRAWVRQGIADEVLVQIYRPDLESFTPHLWRPEVQEARQRIPTAIAIMSGQRNRPAPASLLQQKVSESRQAGLGVGFFYLESLWALGPETAEERQALLARLFAAPAGRLGVSPPAAVVDVSAEGPAQPLEPFPGGGGAPLTLPPPPPVLPGVPLLPALP